MRLLVIEDNDDLAGLLAQGLRSAGYESDRFASVEDARIALSTVSYAALILDLGLTDGDRVQVLDGLKIGERVVVKGSIFIDRAANIF